MFAPLPECGCTLACSAPKSFLARSIASCSTTSTFSQPPYQRFFGITFGVFVGQHRPCASITAGLVKFSLAINSMFSCWRWRSCSNDVGDFGIDGLQRNSVGMM